MELYSEGTITHLQGDLTFAGVTLNIINSLAEALHLATVAGEKKIQVICDKIQSADFSAEDGNEPLHRLTPPVMYENSR
jgi:hypothetical protein